MSFILSLDEGTSSARAVVFDETGKVRGVSQKEFKQHYPQPGLVEHDAVEIWKIQDTVLQGALSNAGLSLKDISAIGITNQRETVVLWNRETGIPLHRAIVWQDRRTADFCNDLKLQGLEGKIQEKTGLVIDAYFSASKLRWLLDNVDGARKLADDGKLAFGTIDSWLIWNLTNGKVHVTDPSNASRTMLYNIHTGSWDNELLSLFNIPASVLPTVVQSSGICGDYHGVPIAGIAGDQQAALFGQACFSPGMVKNTYGTGCFLLMNTGSKAVVSKNKLLSTVAWKINGQTTYALEGSVFIAGALIQWLRDGLGIIKKSSDIDSLAKSVTDSVGVYIVPAFSGLGAPYWNQEARGLICGITRGTSSGHIARAALEAIAFQVTDLLTAMNSDSSLDITELRVDGGASQSDLLMQLQADLSQISVLRSSEAESTAKGAALLAGLATGIWKNTADIAIQWGESSRFNPEISCEHSKVRNADWSRAVHRAQ